MQMQTDLDEQTSRLPEYAYQQLASRNAIRLIKLQRGFGSSGKAKPRIKLEEYKLDACPRFTAVSYVWADPGNATPIVCEGQFLGVTPSCYGALRELARRHRQQLVWIDAICINQADIHEKSTQVAMMCNIYTTAEHVMVWLGEGNAAAHHGMRRLRRCSLVHRLALWEGPLRHWRRQTYMRYIERGFQEQPPGHEHLPAGTVGELLSNQWFERLWTLQEAALPEADRVALYCGRKCVRLGAVMDFADFAMGRDPRIDSFVFDQAMSYCASLSTIHYAKLGDRGPENPFRLFMISKLKYASHPADHIFAMYGLAVNNGLRPPPPDYSKPVDEVYIDITRYCIEYNGKLGILAMAGDASMSALPSWVPDFTVADNSPTGGYNACLSSSNVFSFDASGRQLKVRGLCVDIVHRVGPAIPLLKGVASPRFHALRERFLQTLRTSLPLWYELSQSGKNQSASSPDKKDEFSWTLDLEERTSDDALTSVGVDELLWLVGREPPLSNDVQRRLDFMVTSLAHRLSGRRFFLTSSGRMGLGPETCEPGDTVAIISGLRLPFIIREKGPDFVLIGWAFVYGIMSGQAWPEESLLQDINLV